MSPAAVPHAPWTWPAPQQTRRLPFERAHTVSVRIFLVDDHEPFRQCLAGLLERQPGLSVIGQAGDGRAAIDLLGTLAPQDMPDVMVVDVEMPGIGGIETTQQVRSAHPGVRVVALSMHDDPKLVAAMQAAGAQAYALKSDPLAAIVQAIRDVAALRLGHGNPGAG